MIACECGGCGSTYKVKDQNAGKKFQCKHCDEMVKVPGGGGSKQSSGGGAPKRRKKAARRKEPEYDEYAEDEQDDGYDDYGDDDYGDDDYDDYEERRPAPRSRSPKKSSKKKKRRSSGSGESLLSRYATNPLLWIGVPIGIGMLVGMLSLIAAPAGGIAAIGAIVVCGIISMCCGIHSLVLAFNEDVKHGMMYLFVPFYWLYYLVTRWEEQRKSFVTSISMILAMVLAIVGMRAGG
jgi:hypothetical protein